MIEIIPNLYGADDEGTLFGATNPTIGTGISFGGAAITAFNDTTGSGSGVPVGFCTGAST